MTPKVGSCSNFRSRSLLLAFSSPVIATSLLGGVAILLSVVAILLSVVAILLSVVAGRGGGRGATVAVSCCGLVSLAIASPAAVAVAMPSAATR